VATVRNISTRKKRKNTHIDVGPFGSVFGSAMGRVLDQSLVLGKFEFTVSILAEATGLTFKTVKSCLKRLQDLEWVKQTRRLGNAQAYVFDVENRMSSLVNWATEFHATEINAGIKPPRQAGLPREPELRTEVKFQKPEVQGLLDVIAQGLEESLRGKAWIQLGETLPFRQGIFTQQPGSAHEKLKNMLDNLMLSGKDQSKEVLQVEKRLESVDSLVHSYRNHLDSVLRYTKFPKDPKAIATE
jgi:DNA-binding transcriptional regulator GbsR (MarR family)